MKRPIDYSVDVDALNISYDPSTGILTRHFKNGSCKQTGTRDSNGYLHVRIKSREGSVLVKAHRLAWLLHFGEWPAGEIDHINGDKCDNRVDNLRCADAYQNRQNRPRTDNSTGFRGVIMHRKRYVAQVQAGGVVYRSKSFDTPEEAHLAYLSLAKELHGDFCYPQA